MDTSKCWNCPYCLDNCCINSFDECPQNQEDLTEELPSKTENELLNPNKY